MGNDHIRIDPKYRPQDGGRGKTYVWAGLAAMIAAAFVFGWLLGAPGSIDPAEPSGASAAAPTFPPITEVPDPVDEEEPFPAEEESLPAEDEVPGAGEEEPASDIGWDEPGDVPGQLAALDGPLESEIPGFADTIAMLATPAEGFDVYQWNPGDYEARNTLSLERELGWIFADPVGLDASGNWFAQLLGDGVLTIHPVDPRPGAEPETVGHGVRSVAWHDTEPGEIAWLECPRSPSGTTTLYSLEVSDPDADPVVEGSFERGCGPGDEEIWLERWGDPGAVIIGLEDGPELALVDAAGAVTSLEWPLTPDPYGEYNPDVSGLDTDEQSFESAWSPDGDHLALVVGGGWAFHTLRVVDAGTGSVVAEFAEPGTDVISPVWTTDGRFLLVERWDFESETGALVFFDTDTNTTTRVALTEIVDEIRTTAASPVDWSPISERDRADVNAEDVGPTSGPTGQEPVGGDPSLDASAARLPLGTLNTTPDNPRLDFLFTRCDLDSCYRDAVIINPENERQESGTWLADVPFHIRHGFVNEEDEPLGNDYDLVVYVTRRTGPTGLYELDRTYRFSTDYVLRGATDQCGPGYWDQSESQTCEWFVHDFPVGLPEGRYDIWTEWVAPCTAWQGLGLVDTCADPTETMSRFWSQVNMPFGSEGFEE